MERLLAFYFSQNRASVRIRNKSLNKSHEMREVVQTSSTCGVTQQNKLLF